MKGARAWGLLVVALVGCDVSEPSSSDGGNDAGLAGDPCTPNGHVHREPTGDWCHCERGFRPVALSLGCEVDPDFTGRTTIELAGTAETACWHATHGPFATATAGGRVDDFLTTWELGLADAGTGLFAASVRYRAAVTAPHVATLSSSRINLSVREVLPSGQESVVPILVTQVTFACPLVSQQFGFELVEGAEYLLTFGPSREPRVAFFVDQVR